MIISALKCSISPKMNALNQVFLKISAFQLTQVENVYNSTVPIKRKTKRGAMLLNMVTNKDKSKTWLFNIMQNAPNAKSVFEKVHRPSKRQNVLNSLFIKNITDVLSTGDVAPELEGRGIEITGVKISPCCKVLNVFWQIPPNSFNSHEDIAVALTMCSPRLRAELISRNILGRVPRIFFIRDVTNARLAAFEMALRDADFGPENEKSVIPNDEFTKNLLSFKTPRVSVNEESVPDVPKSTQNNCSTLPQRPKNMKYDVFGINHDAMMSKVVTMRNKFKSPENSAVISSEFFPAADLFDKIPGTPIDAGSDREKLLKQFQLERKLLKQKKDAKTNFKLSSEDYVIDENYSDDHVEVSVAEYEDFVEEETPESSFR